MFTNPSEELVFRVSRTIDGERFRKNFKTRSEAEAERQMIRLNLLQDEIGIRAAATRLTDEELKEAENAFGRLKGCTRGLAFYLDYALANYRDPVHDKPVAEAAREYLALREAHHMRGDLSPGSSRHFAASFAR